MAFIRRFSHRLFDQFFEEILKDLKDGKDLNVFNLGLLSLKETKPRLYHDVNKREVVLSSKHKILRFKFATKVKKKLCRLLDIDKTFKDD